MINKGIAFPLGNYAPSFNTLKYLILITNDVEG